LTVHVQSGNHNALSDSNPQQGTTMARNNGS